MFKEQIKAIKAGIKNCQQIQGHYRDFDFDAYFREGNVFPEDRPRVEALLAGSFLKRLPWWGQQETRYKQALAILADLQKRYRREFGIFPRLHRDGQRKRLGLRLLARVRLSAL